MRNSRIVLGILAVFFLAGCSEKNPIVSDGIFDGDKMKVIKDSIVESIKAYTVSDANAISSPVTNGLIGVHNDNEDGNIYGKTSAGCAFQLRIPGRYRFENEATNGKTRYIDEMTVDSTFLLLAYDQVYFDSTAIQNVNVYELNSDLETSGYYRASEKNRIDLGTVWGEKDFNYEILADTNIIEVNLGIKKVNSDVDSTRMDTLTSNYLAIELSNEYARDKFFNAEAETHYNSQEEFLAYFKGVYVDVDNHANEGALFSFNIGSGKQISSSQVATTQLAMYYSFADTLKKVNTDLDSIVRRPISFRIGTNGNSIRTNFISHDFTGSDLGSALGETSEKETLYVKGAAGTNVKIVMDEINEWKDSLDIAINKADLVIYAEKDSTYNANNPIPEIMNLAFVDNLTEENEVGPVLDRRVQAKFDRSNNSYTFNISTYLQDIIQKKGGLINQYFLLYPTNRKEDPRRIMLANPEDKVGNMDKRIKLSITYTKIK